MASLGEELLNVVNRLQDLVFNTIGNDSLDLPQIVRSAPPLPAHGTEWSTRADLLWRSSACWIFALT
jgi:hypothetical protein